MWQTILALILVVAPFVLVFCFKDRLRGFLYVLVSSIGLHAAAALVTQALHIFTYPVIISIHAVAAILAIAFFFRKKTKINKVRLNWVAFGALVIILFELWSVHYSYSGVISTFEGIDIVENHSYTYPLYSDEWIAVSFADYSIGSKSLPLVNPLDVTSPFINFLAGFHAVIAEVLLFFNLTPLTHYVWLAISNTLLVCMLMFLLMRSMGIGRYASIIPILAVPLITNSGNLPGLWYLLPYGASLSLLLISLIGSVLKDSWLVGASIFISLILYPPMIIFALPIILLRFRWKGLAYLLVAAAGVLVVGIGGFSLSDLLNRATSFLVRDNLDNGIIHFGIWNIVPMYVLPLSAVGLWEIYRRKLYFLSIPMLVGILYWLMYTQVLDVIVIEYPRVVVITCIFLLIAAGFGIDVLVKKFLLLYGESEKGFISKSCIIFIFAFFSIKALFFPGVELWDKLVIEARTPQGIVLRTPAPPVNEHLRQDELSMFSSFEGERFIAPPWKGLVLGVATRNHPLHSKSSTIANRTLEYSVFLEADCKTKSVLAMRHKIDLAYSRPFECPLFWEIDRSGEGLALYRFQPQ